LSPTKGKKEGSGPVLITKRSSKELPDLNNIRARERERSIKQNFDVSSSSIINENNNG